MVDQEAVEAGAPHDIVGRAVFALKSFGGLRSLAQPTCVDMFLEPMNPAAPVTGALKSRLLSMSPHRIGSGVAGTAYADPLPQTACAGRATRARPEALTIARPCPQDRLS